MILVGTFDVCVAEDVPDIDCAVSATDRERALSLSFTEFDQTEDDGWRPFYSSKCYATAASIIVAYIERHPKTASEHHVLPFHAGQMFAMAGDYEKAVQYLKLGYSQRESRLVDWNAFVDAHIAFIERDIDTLREMRERIARQPALQSGPGVPDWAVGKRMNLEVVDGFLACVDEPFDVAYEAPCRPGQ